MDSTRKKLTASFALTATRPAALAIKPRIQIVFHVRTLPIYLTPNANLIVLRDFTSPMLTLSANLAIRVATLATVPAARIAYLVQKRSFYHSHAALINVLPVVGLTPYLEFVRTVMDLAITALVLLTKLAQPATAHCISSIANAM